MTGRDVRIGLVALALAGVLVGCGKGDAAVEAPRPVLVVHPVAEDGRADVAYAGEVRAREESALAFRVGGKLVRRLVDVGDRVHAGQLLAELDPGDLQLQAQAAQAQLAAAQAELARAGADRDRFAKLAQQQLVSRSALDAQNAAYAAAAGQARATRAQLDVARNQAAYAQLRAPRDGVIASRQAEAGQVVAAGQPVFVLAADSGREVAFAVPESGVGNVHAGDAVTVELWNTPDARLHGKLREISPAADPQTRTYAARATLSDAGAVTLGQSARVFLDGAGADRQLSVPLAAVQRSAGSTSAVWVVDPSSRRLHLTPVHLGAWDEDRVPVRSGLRAGDWIVAAGGHLLREGEVVAPVDRENRPVAGR
ncbi:MAG: efflux RND transporter periplasmic adaptor subunit [Lysobacter sp.]|nr:efflux RND transporter periplasmic adaptor subunit [Lysobacter sp.]